MVTIYRILSKVFICFLLIFAGIQAGWAQNQATIGIVLLHGKDGLPSGHIAKLADALREKGYVVSTPTMPWAKGLIYSASYEDCLKLIKTEVYLLRAKGLKNIVVAGHSIGAHMALAYAGIDSDLAGIILLAPGHYPETYARKWKPVSDSVAEAKGLLAQSNDKRTYFNEINNGEEITVLAKPADYLSFCDPDGSGQLSTALNSFRHSLPVLLISECAPRLDPKTAIFDVLPPNGKSQFIKSLADHTEVPDASITDVLKWLKTLAGS
jgi:pimeloyl-ACP methyl ester carboxylesterase